MNDEQNVSGMALWSTAGMEEGLGSHIVDAVACTGNEISIHMAKVTLDNEEMNLCLLILQEGAAIGNVEDQVSYTSDNEQPV